LSLNEPFEPIMEADLRSDLLRYVIDLYARDGTRPDTLEAAAERKNDLLFGNQTFIRLQYCAAGQPSPDSLTTAASNSTTTWSNAPSAPSRPQEAAS
jgi:hypothetical protein